MLASLRSAYPTAQIDWLVRDAFAPVIAHHPALSGVVGFPRGELGAWARGLHVGKLRAWFGALRQRGYDLVFDCQGLARSGLMAWSTRAPVRVGYADARELGWLGVNTRVRTPKVVHTVEKALALLEAVGIPARRDGEASRLHSSPAARAWLTGQPFADRAYAVLAPTSAWPAKQWPADRFAALAGALAARGVVSVVTGSLRERAQVAPLLELAKTNPMVIDRVGGTDVGQLMALIEGARLVVANDSAALHIAVGFGRPLVGLLGPTDMRLASPYGRAHDVIQHVRDGDEFYFRDDRSAGMMLRIGVDEVVRACEARLR